MNRRFLYQWHITNRCNLRCTHCYQSEYCTDTSLDDLKNVMKQLYDFTSYFDASAHINLTGGEPLCSPYLFDVLEMIASCKMTVGLLSNGTLITKKNANRIASYGNITYVQISIDGGRDVHDSIRGEGNFDKAMRGAKLIRKHRIPVYASFTAHKGNADKLKEAIDACRKNSIDYFWTDRMIPFGDEERSKTLSPDEFEQFIRTLGKEAKCLLPVFERTQIKTHRALQFLCGSEGPVYNCEAGDTFFTIDEKLDLLPCRRMPIKVGNLKESSLLSLYLDSPVMQALRRHDIPKACMACSYAAKCRGGLKCLSYAMTGDYNQKDPSCFVIK